jgi:ATP-dependent protease ClpP protease subunit
MYSFFSIRNEASEPAAEVLIYDRIGPGDWFQPDGVSAKAFNNEIAKLPANREIKLRINSPGGSVYEGLAIYNYLKERKDRLTCFVDGMCGSVATIIACAAKKVVMNQATGYFIHKIRGKSSGTAEDLRKSADDMDKVGEQFIDIYAEKTGLKREEIADMMAASTLMNEQEALEKGFVNEIADGDMKASYDKEAFMNEFNSSPSFSNWLDFSKITTKKENNTSMNDDTKLAAGTTEPQVNNLENKIGLSPEEYQEYLENKAQIAKIRKAEADQKRAEITNMVTALVNGGVYSNGVMQNLINGAVNSADQYALLKDSFENFKKNADAQNHVDAGVQLQSNVCTSIEEVDRYRNEFVMAENHVQNNRLLHENKDFIQEKLLTNEITVTSPLKRDHIYKNIMLVAFGKLMFPINDVFACIFKNTPLEGTYKAQIPFYEQDNQSVKDFKYRGTNGGVNEGYQWNGSHQVKNIEVEMDLFKYVDIVYTDRAITEAPVANIPTIVGLKVNNLAYDCWKGILNKITVANGYTQVYPENGNGIALNKWNQNAIVDCCTQLDEGDIPPHGRTFVLNPKYYNQLLKNPVLQASDLGANMMLKGTIEELTDSKLMKGYNLPDNGENLVGFVACAQSLYVVNQPIRPPALSGIIYQVFTDEATGLSFEMCRSGNAQYREEYISLDVHFGARPGYTKALTRITKPA